MKIIRNNILLFKGFAAINLFGVLFVRNNIKLTYKMLNHEQIHTAQMKELWYVGFYIAYIVNWMINLILFFDFHKAYREVVFEKEAYDNEANCNYLASRRKFSYLR